MQEKDWIRDALAVQDACNAVAVVLSFHKLLSWMRDNGKDYTYPPFILYRDKIEDMFGRHVPDFNEYCKAYSWCEENNGR